MKISHELWMDRREITTGALNLDAFVAAAAQDIYDALLASGGMVAGTPAEQVSRIAEIMDEAYEDWATRRTK
jgi:hypothetical protein